MHESWAENKFHLVFEFSSNCLSSYKKIGAQLTEGKVNFYSRNISYSTTRLISLVLTQISRHLLSHTHSANTLVHT